MSNDSPVNPYTPPPTDPGADAFIDPAALARPASRFKRFIAFWIDALIMGAITVPMNILTGFTERAMMGTAGLLEQFLMSLAGMLVFLVVFGYLLVTRGQTIGKLLIGVRIVDHQSGELLSFTRVYLLRYLWSFPFVVLVTLIPGTFDDTLFGFLILIDSLMIFGRERRCLHDLIAGSKVVEVVR